MRGVREEEVRLCTLSTIYMDARTRQACSSFLSLSLSPQSVRTSELRGLQVPSSASGAPVSHHSHLMPRDRFVQAGQVLVRCSKIEKSPQIRRRCRLPAVRETLRTAPCRTSRQRQEHSPEKTAAVTALLLSRKMMCVNAATQHAADVRLDVHSSAVGECA